MARSGRGRTQAVGSIRWCLPTSESQFTRPSDGQSSRITPDKSLGPYRERPRPQTLPTTARMRGGRGVHDTATCTKPRGGWVYGD